jgi:uncharacterized protein (DUF1330 family)
LNVYGKRATENERLFNSNTIHDQETFKRYVEAGSSLAAKFNGKIIAFDTAPKVVEGNAEAIMAIMEFDTFADANRFYNSPEYTAARQFRVASTTSSIVLLEGLPQNNQ